MIVARALRYVTLLSIFPAYVLCAQPSLNEMLHRRVHEIIPTAPMLPEKEYTFAVYIAARNDLGPFVAKNLEQMMRVGSSDNLTIVVHLDSMTKDNKMVTQRFIVHRNKLIQVGEITPMDSGIPETLIDFCGWAFTHFPCRQPMLTLWSHGIGDLEIERWIRSTHPLPKLYLQNPATNLLEINRSIDYFEYIDSLNPKQSAARGICFDDITGHCLTNRNVNTALTFVRDTYLGGQPFSCILLDACLMNSIGFMFSLKPYRERPVAEVAIGSQESVLAAGYNYERLLAPLASKRMSVVDFAHHVTQAFAETYNPIIRDYTQSAIALASLDPLYEAIDQVAHSLLYGLSHQKSLSVENFIETCSSRNNCTYFAESSYKDMHHLFYTMYTNLSKIVLQDAADTQRFRAVFSQQLQEACRCIKQAVISNRVGSGLSQATGISIYLPRKRGGMHYSFQHTDFGKHSVWRQLIQLYAQHSR